MMSLERTSGRPTSQGLHHGSLDFNVTVLIEEVSQLPDNLAPCHKNISHFLVDDQIQITLPIASLHVR